MHRNKQRTAWSYTDTELDQQYLQGDQTFKGGLVVIVTVMLTIFTYLYLK